MADDTDFHALYRELAVDPSCTPEALKRAYRRRVAALHPDRQGVDADRDAALADAEALKRLNQRYEAALAFHREHGRLPGSTVAAPRSPSRRPAPEAGVAPSRRPSPRTAVPATGTGPRWTRWLLALAVALGAWWMFGQAPLPAPGERRDSGVAAPEIDAASVRVGELRLGMAVADVRAIQGDPIGAEGPRWLYGASWLLFHCGELADWYSSPLQPLKTAGIKPPDPDPRQPPPVRRHCPPTPPPTLAPRRP